MNQKIRRSVFETNSSSSHSLTVGTAKQMLTFPDDQLRAGIVQITLQEFGWEWMRYYKPENKASYLIIDAFTDAAYFEQCREMQTMTSMQAREYIRSSSERGAKIIDAIEKHTGCTVQIVPQEYFYIDHQSRGLSADAGETPEEIVNFIFSADSCITTGNDNQEPPRTVFTDLNTTELMEQSR